MKARVPSKLAPRLITGWGGTPVPMPVPKVYNPLKTSVVEGVFMAVVPEMGLISPSVGVNVFLAESIAEGVPFKEIRAGVLPFRAAMGVCLVLLAAFTDTALVLPKAMTESGSPLALRKQRGSEPMRILHMGRFPLIKTLQSPI